VTGIQVFAFAKRLAFLLAYSATDSDRG